MTTRINTGWICQKSETIPSKKCKDLLKLLKKNGIIYQTYVLRTFCSKYQNLIIFFFLFVVKTFTFIPWDPCSNFTIADLSGDFLILSNWRGQSQRATPFESPWKPYHMSEIRKPWGPSIAVLVIEGWPSSNCWSR